MTIYARNDLLTVAQAAAGLGVSVDTVRRWLKSGRLRAVRIGPRRVCIPRSDVEGLDGGQQPAPAAKLPQGINRSPLTDEEVAATLRFLEQATALARRIADETGHARMPESWILINEERDRRSEQQAG